jgi:hypothetical protein
MRLYCKAGTIIATHGDDQLIDTALYGDGVTVLVVPDNSGAIAGAPVPALTGEVRRQTINHQCWLRITAVLGSSIAQSNMTAYATALIEKKADGETLVAEEAGALALMRAGRAWVASMQTACRTLIADPSADYLDDGEWPAAPAGLATLAAQF